MIDERDRLVIGAPGGLSLWCFHALKTLATRATPVIPVHYVDRLCVVPPLPADHRARLLLCHYPSSEVLYALAAQPIRTACLFEPPLLSVNYLMTATGRTGLEAIRVCTASYVANLLIGRAERSMSFDRSATASVASALKAVCSHLALAVRESVIEDTIVTLTNSLPSDPVLEHAITRFLPAASSAFVKNAPVQASEARTLVSAILDPIASWARPQVPAPTEWIPDCFTWTDSNARVGEKIELMGPARALCHGPYLYLPPSTYDAEFYIALPEALEDVQLRIDIYSGADCLCRARIEPSTSGRFKAPFSFVLRSAESEVQAQIISERGAIDGCFLFQKLALTPRNA